MLLNQFALAVGKKRAVLFAGEHREKTPSMRIYAAEVIRHAHGVRRVGFDQRGTLGRLGHDVVDKHATVDQIDLLGPRRERFPSHASSRDRR